MDWRPPFRKLLVEFNSASRQFGGKPDKRSGYPDEWDRPDQEAAFFHEIIKRPEGENRKPSDMRWFSKFPEPWQKDVAWSYHSDEKEYVFGCGRVDAFLAFQDLSERAAGYLPPTVVVPEPLHTFAAAPTHLERYLIDRWARFVYQQLDRHPGFIVRRHAGWMELSCNFFAASALAIEMSILPVADPAELAAATNAGIQPSERRTLSFWIDQFRLLAGRDYFADREKAFALQNIGALARLAVEAGALGHPDLKSIAALDWRRVDEADAAMRLLTALRVPMDGLFKAPDVAKRLADVLGSLKSSDENATTSSRTRPRPASSRDRASRSTARAQLTRTTDADRDGGQRAALTPYEKRVCAWVLSLTGHWIRPLWDKLTHTDEQAVGRLIGAGLVEARFTVTLTVRGVAPLVTAWRVSGDYGRVLTEQVKQFLASRGHAGVECGIVTGDYEGLRLTSEGELAKSDFHGRVDKYLFDLVAGGPGGSRGLTSKGIARLDGDPLAAMPVVAAPPDGAKDDGTKPDEATAAYRKALRVLHDAGCDMEKHPSIYQGKDEEAIRDYLLVVLSSHFQSATAETFNKTGKTDMLVRHSGVRVLLAECKVWGGPKLLRETIDQALGYATWRDARVAVLLFVPNRGISPVLQQVATLPETHPCCTGATGHPADGWYDFDFHLPGDPSHPIRLAVLCFHFPPPGKPKPGQ